MRYRLEYREPVREYFRILPLTREGRVKLNAALIEMAAEVEDSFRFRSGYGVLRIVYAECQ